MSSFLITFKPASENRDRGWPLEKLERLVVRLNDGEEVVEDWRFRNRKDVSVGDRVFLLRQGKGGPAIIGYGKTAGPPKNEDGHWQVPIHFERLVDSTREVFASKNDLAMSQGAASTWRAESSGIRLRDAIAAELESLIVGSSAKLISSDSGSNPNWSRDELILALSFYLRHRPNPPRKNSLEIIRLSETLNCLGEQLFPAGDRSRTFRNPNGVYMKLMNFRRLDPEYTGDGKAGLSQGSSGDVEVWKEFAHKPAECQGIAEAIVRAINDADLLDDSSGAAIEEYIEEAPEGRILTRIHLVRERNRSLVESKRKQVFRKFGRLACEACDFDFSMQYGLRGKGFIECHHTKPVGSLSGEQKTHLNDLALVCANCHRIIHRSKPWLSIDGVKALVRQTRRM